MLHLNQKAKGHVSEAANVTAAGDSAAEEPRSDFPVGSEKFIYLFFKYEIQSTKGDYISQTWTCWATIIYVISSEEGCLILIHYFRGVSPSWWGGSGHEAEKEIQEGSQSKASLTSDLPPTSPYVPLFYSLPIVLKFWIHHLMTSLISQSLRIW